MANEIEQIKSLANIVELISEIIPVKKSGANYVSICPFHNDTKPSMFISPSKGIYKCFSCGAGGDVFKFWSDYYQKDFKETLKDLAEKYGVELKQGNSESTQEFNLKIKMHNEAAQYYYDQLLASSDARAARDYIQKRDISTASINQFTLGYSPADQNDWGKLIKHLKDKLKVTEDQIVEAGLAIKSEKNGRYFDRFRGRLMIPIKDERSRVLGFGARILPGSDDKAAKYINSPETSTYNKGSVLYGMDLAKDEIKKQDAVILVEGFFDVISLVEAGFKNVVANQGTALTQKQIKVMSKFTQSKKIYLCLDSDTAGEKACERAAENIAQVFESGDYELRIIRTPGGKDPDEFIKANSKEAFQELITNAPIFTDYKINKIISGTDTSTSQGKARAVREAAKYLGIINNKILFSEYQKQIAEKLGLDEASTISELNREINNLKNQNPYQEKPENKPKQNNAYTMVNGHLIFVEDAIYGCEQEFLLLALQDRLLLERFMQEEECLISAEHNEVLEALVEVSFENPDVNDLNQKFEMLSKKLFEKRHLNKQVSDLGIKIEKLEERTDMTERFHESMKKLKESRLKMQIHKLKEDMKKLDDSSHEWLVIQQEKINLEKEMQKVKLLGFQV